MTAEPIRSVLGSVTTEDTSLVLPSDKKQRTGQQRVLEQVKSIKRGKSKVVKKDSIPSPTTPASVTEYSEPKFQFSPTKMNGTLFRYSNSNMTTNQRSNVRSMSVRNTVRRQTQNSQWESQMGSYSVQSQSNGVKPNGSEPSLTKASGTIKQKFKERSGTVNYKQTTVQSMKLDNNPQVSTGQSQATMKVTTKNKSEAVGANGVMESMPNITLQEAVKYLSHSDISQQLLGASYIQHHTFSEDLAKEEVSRLAGIEPLIMLLKSDNPQLQLTAAAALRNLVFKHNKNKEEVYRNEGIEAILTLLRNTSEEETQKQLTGLLWNLSSADQLKPELIKNALPLLTECVVVPYNLWSEGYKYIDSEVFYNTTGCLRNLSCADQQQERMSMRYCPKLIDSLMIYIQTQIERANPDEKSVENCVCILHNLSYQLEKEASEDFSVLDDKAPKNTGKKALFSPKSNKTQKDLFSFPAMEQPQPNGVKWLYNKKSLKMYLSLLASSQNEATLEACCGALQNLTASKSPVSTVMSQAIIQKLQGLPTICPLLRSSNPGLQKTAMSLVGNMSRVSSLRGVMAREVLPVVGSVISAAPDVNSDSTIATACRVMNTLMLSDPDTSKRLVNPNLIDNLTTLTHNMSFGTARKAAGVLLYSMWGQKDIQSELKKQGMIKDTFINEVTLPSYNEATRKNGH